MKAFDSHFLLFTVGQKAGWGGKTSTKIIVIVPTLLSTCFMYTKHLNNTKRQELLSPLYRGGYWGQENLRNLPEEARGKGDDTMNL